MSQRLLGTENLDLRDGAKTTAVIEAKLRRKR